MSEKASVSDGSQRTAGRETRLAAGAGLVVVGLLALVVFSVTSSGDYGVRMSVGADNAAPGLEALLHGNVAGYLAHQPLISLTTILLRLPFAGVASVLGGNDLMTYKFGAFACMLPLALGAAWLIAAPGLPLNARVLRLLGVLVVIQSPILRSAVASGHPEDVVAAVLASAAVVLAARGHARWAAVLLGLAIGSKEWAVIAVLPVMIALPGRRWEAGAITAGLVVLLVGVPWLGDPAAFDRAQHAARDVYLSALSPLWPTATPIHVLGGVSVPVRRAPWGLGRLGASSIQFAVAAILGGVWCLRRRRTGLRCDPICMLALLGALRCICDPVDEQYYWLATLIPIAAWETTEMRVPVLTLLVSITVWALFSGMSHTSSTFIYLASLTAQAALVMYLARQTVGRAGKAERSALQLSAPAGQRFSQAAQHMYSVSKRKLKLEPR
jgi:hypothetical protein